MNPNVITVDADDSMLDATKLLKEHNIRHLPVLEKGKLVGVITDRDLKRASPSDATALEAHELLYLIANIKVREIMTKNPITVPYNYTIEEAAELLLQARISGMPVVDKDGDVIGTITQTDLFKVLISLTGVGKKGVQFAFLLEDRAGSIKDVADVIRAYGGRMASILSSYEKAPEGHRYVYIRMYDVNQEKMPQLKEDLKKKAKVLYIVDSRDNKREIFIR
ncbi:MAG: CBS and ACT domain-containing protein [Deltaproteobacteria bacterium]|nr:CBS and ACT domain-containing protein [Deltaproteobacteria bacterium]